MITDLRRSAPKTREVAELDIDAEINRLFQEINTKRTIKRDQERQARLDMARDEERKRPDPYWQSVIKHLEAGPL